MAEERKPQPLVLILTEDRAAFFGVLGALAVITGSVLTWATVPVGFATISVPGIEANGKITVILGALSLALVVASLRLHGRDLPIAAAVAGLGGAGVAFVYLLDLRSASAQVLARVLATRTQLDPDAVAVRFGAQAGPGVWVVAAGGVLVALAAVALLVRDRGTPAR